MSEIILEKHSAKVDLTKGSKLNLTKKNKSLKNINLCLGWITKKDLDSSAVLRAKDSKVIKTVSFMNKKENGIFLHGDNLVGGKGDCETISIYLDKIDSEVHKISLFANIFGIFGTRATFAKVKKSYIRLVDMDCDKELCRYSLTEDISDFSACHFADIVRDDLGDWSFIVVGNGLNGQIKDIEKYCNATY